MKPDRTAFAIMSDDRRDMLLIMLANMNRIRILTPPFNRFEMSIGEAKKLRSALSHAINEASKYEHENPSQSAEAPPDQGGDEAQRSQATPPPPDRANRIGPRKAN